MLPLGTCQVLNIKKQGQKLFMETILMLGNCFHWLPREAAGHDPSALTEPQPLPPIAAHGSSLFGLDLFDASPDAPAVGEATVTAKVVGFPI